MRVSTAQDADPPLSRDTLDAAPYDAFPAIAQQQRDRQERGLEMVKKGGITCRIIMNTTTTAGQKVGTGGEWAFLKLPRNHHPTTGLQGNVVRDLQGLRESNPLP